MLARMVKLGLHTKLVDCFVHITFLCLCINLMHTWIHPGFFCQRLTFTNFILGVAGMSHCMSCPPGEMCQWKWWNVVDCSGYHKIGKSPQGVEQGIWGRNYYCQKSERCVFCINWSGWEEFKPQLVFWSSPSWLSEEPNVRHAPRMEQLYGGVNLQLLLVVSLWQLKQCWDWSEELIPWLIKLFKQKQKML